MKRGAVDEISRGQRWPVACHDDTEVAQGAVEEPAAIKRMRAQVEA